MKNCVEYPQGVVNQVEVSFTQREWNLAKDGMNKLLKERDNISENIYKTISDINKNIFSKDIIFSDDVVDDDPEKEEKKHLNTSTTSYHLFDKVIFSFVVFVFLRPDRL